MSGVLSPVIQATMALTWSTTVGFLVGYYVRKFNEPPSVWTRPVLNVPKGERATIEGISIDVVDPGQVRVRIEGWDPCEFRLQADEARTLAGWFAIAANLARPLAVCTCEPTRPPGDHERVCPAFGVRS